jgi:hypothetical protein
VKVRLSFIFTDDSSSSLYHVRMNFSLAVVCRSRVHVVLELCLNAEQRGHVQWLLFLSLMSFLLSFGNVRHL